MKYYTASEIAEQCNLTERRVQQMCKSGTISGAIKEGNSWRIPESSAKDLLQTSPPFFVKPPAVGISDFKRAVDDYYYVDKTLMIRDLLDKKPQVSLFTRPRRFGKTLNMDMLRVFFERSDEDTSRYFRDKKIWSCGSRYTSHQGQYPVIYLSFKDVAHTTWEETYRNIAELISLEFRRHSELEYSEKLSQTEKDIYSLYANRSADVTMNRMSLQYLSAFLFKHYNKRAIIIIDEYDTPIHHGHLNQFYRETVDFMRGLFSGGLKDNQYLEYGFLTGILRVAKESIFSGLNNLKINSILDEAYSEYFGFTKDEVKQMLAAYGYSDQYREVCEWYDGYRFGDREIFNPWSVINYISDQCTPKPFWLSTGSNAIIGEAITGAGLDLYQNLHRLLRGETVTTYIDTGVIYPEVRETPSWVFSFLLVAGYLKIDRVYPQTDGNYICDVAVPNKEINFVYEKEIINRIGSANTPSLAIEIQSAIFRKDIPQLGQLLEDYMKESVSFYDTANESFYHGMMLGLCAILNNRYEIRSNRESGTGRFDIALFPRIAGLPAYIFEFKHAAARTADLNSLSEGALRQIEANQYDTELIQQGISSILKVGIAFQGKRAAVKWKE